MVPAHLAPGGAADPESVYPKVLAFLWGYVVDDEWVHLGRAGWEIIVEDLVRAGCRWARGPWLAHQAVAPPSLGTEATLSH